MARGAEPFRKLDAASLALVRLALNEDLSGYGDVTSRWTVPRDRLAWGVIATRQDAVISGLGVAAAVLAEVDLEAQLEARVADGERAQAGQSLAFVRGRAESLLTAERTMLNFLTHLSGVATQTARFVDAVAGTGARVIDTRKTTPGMRALEKQAVRHGGGGNHRFGLFDMVLIKDNHLLAAGGVRAAVERARRQAPLSMKIEIEVTDEAGLREALDAGADIVMLDNVGPEELGRLVSLARALRPEVVLEASGGVTLETVRAVAESGVDVISTSALTAGAPPVDIGLDFSADLEEE